MTSIDLFTTVIVTDNFKNFQEKQKADTGI